MAALRGLQMWMHAIQVFVLSMKVGIDLQVCGASVVESASAFLSSATLGSGLGRRIHLLVVSRHRHCVITLKLLRKNDFVKN